MNDLYDLPPTFGQLPPKVGGGGYVYAVDFTDGIVKVGTTNEPEQRIASLTRDGAAFGVAATQAWVSPHHADPYRTEAALIGIASQFSAAVRNREYFAGCRFGDVVRHARLLPFPQVDAGCDVDSEVLGEHIVSAVKRIWSRTAGDSAGQMGAVIGRLFWRAGVDYDLPTECTDISFKDACRVADSLGITVDSVLRMSLLDIQLLSIRTIVDTEARLLAARAHAVGRTDLTDPIRCCDLPSDEDEARAATTELERTSR